MKKFLISLLLIPGIALADTGFQNEALTTRYNTAGTGGPAAMNKYGQLMCSLNSGVAAATNPIKLEDSAHTTADAGIFSLGVVNTGLANPAANGDYTYFGLGAWGQTLSTLVYDSSAAIQAASPIRAEDSPFAASEIVLVAGAQALSAIAQSVGTSGDIAPPSMDLGNRLVTTNAPAGETFNNCGTATATTADVQIKGNVASNRIYVTTLTCKSTDADNATSLDFKDGATVVAVGGVSQMATASDGSFVATFPVPIRLTSNTSLNFATNVSTSSVTCCAQGYISTI